MPKVDVPATKNVRAGLYSLSGRAGILDADLDLGREAAHSTVGAGGDLGEHLRLERLAA